MRKQVSEQDKQHASLSAMSHAPHADTTYVPVCVRPSPLLQNLQFDKTDRYLSCDLLTMLQVL